MDNRTAFYGRYHKLKERLQSLEERQYAVLLREEQDLTNRWQTLNAQMQNVRQAAHLSKNVTSWMMYEQYAQRLQRDRETLERQWNVLQGELGRQKIKVQDAYRAQETWSTIKNQAFEVMEANQAQVLQSESDELAMIRYRKGE